MNTVVTLFILLLAAGLEAGGDAIVRAGLHSEAFAVRAALFAAGGAVLLAYGVVVNAPPWDFGRLLGVYVTLFFLVAQVINLVVFGVRPGLPILVGGGMTLAGGLVITLWRSLGEAWVDAEAIEGVSAAARASGLNPGGDGVTVPRGKPVHGATGGPRAAETVARETEPAPRGA
jgi:small multidrug resistance family-3 protein